MNFLIITCRRLAREKFYALVCILSLALGFASSILISLFLMSELTFDLHHQNHERIYRVNSVLSDLELPVSGYEIGPLLVRDNPQFLESVRFRRAFESEFTYGESINSWANVFHTDANVFDIFTITPLLGDIDSAFDDPYSIAVSESFAEYYFGDQDSIGEILSTERFELRVSLVFEDLPENVTERYDALLPFELVAIYQPESLVNFGQRYLINANETYLYVAEDFDPLSIEAASDYLFETYMETEFLEMTGRATGFNLSVEKLSDIHFRNTTLFDDGTGGNVTNLYIFAAVAIALLVISCINYVNLATARAAVRLKEVAMRKILGASNRNLILQFLSESILFIGLAFGIGILLSMLAIALGYVESFTGKAELSSLLLTPARLSMFVFVGLAIGVVSGIYPALTLARQSMMAVLKPQQRSWRLGLPLRQLLVLMQMIASMVIVSCVFIMLQQAKFLVESPMGFRKDNQLITRIRGETIRSRDAIMTELTRHNEILSVVEMNGALGRGLSVSMLDVEDNNGQTVSVTTNNFQPGVGFLETLEIELLQGNMFRAEQAGIDNPPILVNETFVNQMEWTQPIGKKVGDFEVIGVIRDFHYLPLYVPIAPVFIMPYSDRFLDELEPRRLERVSMDLTISITGINLTETTDYIKGVIAQFSNQPIIEVQSLNDVWNEMYDTENQTIVLVGVFSAICIVISLLGLAGLASYSTQQRAKEIAIRKVLGASVSNIIGLLSLNMIKVIALSIIPAIVGAYYISNVWLERFSYRVQLGSMPYIMAVALVGILSIAILVSQTYRTAQENPVNRLKYE